MFLEFLEIIWGLFDIESEYKGEEYIIKAKGMFEKTCL
jgi:hypothetical protein